MPASSDPVFLDTNILIYAIEVDGPEPAKTAAAQEAVRRSDVVLSTQVLGEFYRAVTSPRRESPLDPAEATAWIQMWKRFDVRDVTVRHVDLALEIAQQCQVGYYGALILAAARKAECPVVYSEDLSDGQDYGGVTVVNPFASQMSRLMENPILSKGLLSRRRVARLPDGLTGGKTPTRKITRRSQTLN